MSQASVTPTEAANAAPRPSYASGGTGEAEEKRFPLVDSLFGLALFGYSRLVRTSGICGASPPLRRHSRATPQSPMWPAFMACMGTSGSAACRQDSDRGTVHDGLVAVAVASHMAFHWVPRPFFLHSARSTGRPFRRSWTMNTASIRRISQFSVSRYSSSIAVAYTEIGRTSVSSRG